MPVHNHGVLCLKPTIHTKIEMNYPDAFRCHLYDTVYLDSGHYTVSVQMFYVT